MKKLIPVTLLLVVILVLAALPAAAQDGPQTPAELCAAATPAEMGSAGPFDAAEQVLEDGADYLAVFCTSAGPILVDLFEDQTPVTVNNFVFLAQSGFYNNINFHRVIPDFMAQGGDPSNTGSSGPGYQFEDEIVDGLVFDRPGLLAMANAGPGTNGSQFFITTVPTDWLNGMHTIFGEVLAGQDNVLAIRERDPQRAFGPGTLLETVVIVDDPAAVEVVEETLTPADEDAISAAWDVLPQTALTVLGRYGVGFGSPDLTEMMALDEDAFTAGPVDDGSGATFHASATLVNTSCALEDFPVYALTYGLTVYPTAEEAQAALEDPVLAEAQVAEGFEAVETELDGLIFQQTVSACDQDDMVLAREFLQRGRFVATLEATTTAANADIAAFLPEAFTGPLFEDALHTIIRPETVTSAE